MFMIKLDTKRENKNTSYGYNAHYNEINRNTE